MRAWAHDGGFSVDGSVRIEGTDRTGLERRTHLRQRDTGNLVYRNPKSARGTAPGVRPAVLVPMKSVHACYVVSRRYARILAASWCSSPTI